MPFLSTVIESVSDVLSPLNGDKFLFNGYFSCEKCGEHVSSTGVLLKAQIMSDKPSPEYIKVEHFSPTVPIFPLSENIPTLIVDELLDAFKYFHFDPPSAASKLRRSIEKFCADMNVEGSNLNRKVQNLAKTHPEEASYLEALKLVGNEGTHGSNVDELDLIYAFEMFQFVLELYDRKARFGALQESYEKLAEKVGKERLQLTYKKEAFDESK